MRQLIHMYYKNGRARAHTSIQAYQFLMSIGTDVSNRFVAASYKEPADLQDDSPACITSNNIAYIPIPPLAHSIPFSASDRRDTAGVPVPPPRRSAAAITRFHPVLGWRTILQLLARRAAESIAFSVPDRNALWSRAEDGLLNASCSKV